jgi:hypothetical protein
MAEPRQRRDHKADALLDLFALREAFSSFARRRSSSSRAFSTLSAFSGRA